MESIRKMHENSDGVLDCLYQIDQFQLSTDFECLPLPRLFLIFDRPFDV